MPIAKISIHASHAGRDLLGLHSHPTTALFQSTRPMRDATNGFATSFTTSHISIHASHAGRDKCQTSAMLMSVKFQSTRPMRDATAAAQSPNRYIKNFNPRVPCGTRHHWIHRCIVPHIFQSTRPMRDATTSRELEFRGTQYFNPRVRCGTRLYLHL